MKKLVVMFFIFNLVGCGVMVPLVRRESKVNEINPGMSKEEVINLLGKPSAGKDTTKWNNGNEAPYTEHFLYSKGASPVQLLSGFTTLTMGWWVPFHWMTTDTTFMGKLYKVIYESGKVKTVVEAK